MIAVLVPKVTDYVVFDTQTVIMEIDLATVITSNPPRPLTELHWAWAPRALLDLILTTMVELGPDQVRDVSIVIDRWEKFPQDRLGEQPPN